MHSMNNIKLQQVGCGGVDWIQLAQARWQALVTVVMNLQVP